MKNNIIKDKSFVFAIRIVNVCRYLSTTKNEFVLSQQLLRSGTSIGAMIRESEHAESKADFNHKLAIAQKETNESLYWLELLYKTDYITQEEFKSLNLDAVELIKLLTAILKSSKTNLPLTIEH